MFYDEHTQKNTIYACFDTTEVYFYSYTIHDLKIKNKTVSTFKNIQFLCLPFGDSVHTKGHHLLNDSCRL